MTTNSWNSEYNNTDGKLLIGNTSNSRPLEGDLTNTDGALTFTYNDPNIEAEVSDSSSAVAFYAVDASSDADVTGDGSEYQLVLRTVVFDLGSDYDNSTGRFTAPQDGTYDFTVSATFTNVGTQSIFYYRILIYDSTFSTIQKMFEVARGNLSAYKNDGNNANLSGSVITQMAQDEIAVCVVSAGAGADPKTVGVLLENFIGVILG